MRILDELNLKWIEASKCLHKELDLKYTLHCTFVIKDKEDQITGLTPFSPRDFSESFVNRLKSRIARPEYSQSKFELYLPPFLSFRANQMISGNISVIYSPFFHFRLKNKKISIRHKIRMINVDDSNVVLKFLNRVSEDLGYIETVAQVDDSRKAIEKIKELVPDIITLDIQMPHLTGVDLVKNILSESHYPIIMISSLSLDEGSMVFEALNNGAFDYLQKPQLNEKSTFQEEFSSRITQALESKRMKPLIKNHVVSSTSINQNQLNYSPNLIWCLGASTGGTQALTQVFTNLPAKIPPTLVVQHIPPLFSRAFAESLDQLCPFKVKEAQHDEEIQANHVYIAPGGTQMGIEKKSGRIYIQISDDPPVNRFKPSVDYLFSKVAQFKDLQIVAGIFTGMGKDGSHGLLELKNKGGTTFAQNEESCVVYGMPRAAFEIGATKNMIHLEKIPSELLELSLKNK